AWRRDHGAPTSRTRAGQEVFSPCAAAALYRRGAFLEAGGFDERFFCYYEDSDLAFRLRLLGHRCLHVDDAVVHHVGSVTAGRTSDFTVYHSFRNQGWAFVKNMPAPLLWLYLPQHVLLNALQLLGYRAAARPRVILRAKRGALRGLARCLVLPDVLRGVRGLGHPDHPDPRARTGAGELRAAGRGRAHSPPRSLPVGRARRRRDGADLLQRTAASARGRRDRTADAALRLHLEHRRGRLPVAAAHGPRGDCGDRRPARLHRHPRGTRPRGPAAQRGDRRDGADGRTAGRDPALARAQPRARPAAPRPRAVEAA